MVRKRLRGQQAANYILESCQRGVDRARTDRRVIPDESRTDDLPESIVSFVLANVFFEGRGQGLHFGTGLPHWKACLIKLFMNTENDVPFWDEHYNSTYSPAVFTVSRGRRMPISVCRPASTSKPNSLPRPMPQSCCARSWPRRAMSAA